MRNTPAIPLTDWTLIQTAGLAQSDVQRDALHAVVLRYLPALHAHINSYWRFPGVEADDLVQAFLTAKLVQGNLLSDASPQRGRFRNLLRTSLDDFVVSHIRHGRAGKRYPGPIASLQVTAPAPDRGLDPHQSFEIAWARQVLSGAIDRTRLECEKSHRPDLWGVFVNRVIEPTVDSLAQPMPYEELVRQFGFRSPTQAANALTTAKRMFKRNLRAVLSEYVRDEAEIDVEILELKAVLSRARA